MRQLDGSLVMKGVIFTLIGLAQGGVFQNLSANAVHGAEIWYHDYEQAAEEAKKKDRPLLVHVSATWCPPCKRMESEVLGTNEVREEIAGDLIAVKVDRDQRPDLVERLGVQSIPTDVIVDPQGRVLSSSVGFRERSGYVNWMHEVAARHQEAQRIRLTRTIAGNDANQQLQTRKLNEMPPAEKAQVVGLDGYCPVVLKDQHKWVEGNSQYQAKHMDLVFYFSTEKAHKEFKADPDKYIPQLLGCDPVVMWESNRAVIGDTSFGAYFNGQLYLFSNGENRQLFKLDPSRYVRTRQALKLEDLEIQTVLK
jgi:YHS domain-containing protein/thiol-disulfide isomerase/thioredoxin